jgi:hypothetical protein
MHRDHARGRQPARSRTIAAPDNFAQPIARLIAAL